MTTQNVPIVTGSVVDADVSANAKIDADKLEHRHAITYHQADGTDVATESAVVHVARAKGSIKSVEVAPNTAPTGGDKQYTVDVLKSTGGGAFATVLSAVVTMSSADSDRTLEAGVISSAAYADGDLLQVSVTASGSTGSQGQGVAVTINVDEEP